MEGVVRSINPTLRSNLSATNLPLSFHKFSRIRVASTTKHASLLMVKNKAQKEARQLISISSASNGRWSGKWNCDYIFSLRDLHLEDLAEDGCQDTEVFVSLCLHKHTGFGLSIEGRVVTSISRKCSICSTPYSHKINKNFNVWILTSAREDRSNQMPEIGGDDPSVIYVKPGCEAVLDSFIQDTIRLHTSVQETCSERCDKSEPKLQYIGVQRTASIDKRWSKLLELKNAIESP